MDYRFEIGQEVRSIESGRTGVIESREKIGKDGCITVYYLRGYSEPVIEKEIEPIHPMPTKGAP